MNGLFIVLKIIGGLLATAAMLWLMETAAEKIGRKLRERLYGGGRGEKE